MFEPLSFQERYRGCLLSVAIGDTLGMPSENKTRTEIVEAYGYLQEYQPGYLPAGHYTDDAQQTIILAESLLEDHGFNQEKYCQRLIQKTDLSRGIGPNLGRFILASRAAGKPCYDLLVPLFPSNGLGMKIASVALFYQQQPQRINEIVEALGSITHRHPGSIAGAVAVAHGVHYALQHSLETFQKERYIEHIVGEVIKYDRPLAEMIASGRTIDDLDASVYSTVPKAVLTFANNPADFQGGVLSLVNSGGDTDTKAAMFGAISGAFNGLDKIPSSWFEGLENGVQGRDYILSLAEKLFTASSNTP